jgi:hypothetical protein
VPQAGRQADHRHRGLHGPRHRPSARAPRPVDDSGGEAEGGKKLYYHLTLLAENNTGYRNLIQLSSRAFLEGYYYKPRSTGSCSSRAPRGLIATTGCLGGHVLQALLRGDVSGRAREGGRLQDIFGRDNLFVELQDHGIPEQRDQPEAARDRPAHRRPAARHQRQPLHPPATTHEAHDALLCVQTASLMSDPNRFKFEGDEHYLKSAAEMRHLFREVPEACDNTLWIAERCDVEIEFGKPQLPNFPLPEGFADDAEYLATSPSRRRGAVGRPLPDGRRAPRLRAQVIATWGSLVLPHRVGPHQARQGPGIRVGPGPRLGGRLRGGLLPADHRPRPHQVRPAVRAVPQPEPHLDARHRHGLRLALPRRDDPLRGRALRPRPRRPDRHVLHDQGPGRGARRRPGARLPVLGGRQGRQGDAAARHGPRHAAVRLPRGAPEVRRRLQDGRRAARDVRRPTPT